MTTKKKFLFLLTGLLIMSCGINVIIYSTLGASAWDAANFTIAIACDISPGMAVFLTGVALTLSVEILGNRKLSLAQIKGICYTTIIGFMLGILINVTKWIIGMFVPPIKLIGIIGIAIFALGISLIACSELPGDPINN
ncbi:MAG: hypothetical protein ACK5G7_06590, partial [Erysipelotrichaceae bacterium]